MTARNETPTIDKLDIHHRQQLSALVDGELAADEARFLLRRLQHDHELAGRWERWQLCGDVLRGKGHAPAPAGFAERVAQAIAAESSAPAASAAPHAQATRPRNLLARWGGGALAASVALVALFMARQQSPQDMPVGEGTQMASTQATSPELRPEAPAAPAPDAEAYAAAAVAVAASVPPRQEATRRSATRSQQAARSAQRVARADVPARANGTAQGAPRGVDTTTLVAAAPVPAVSSNPFSHRPQEAGVVASRPWPRSALSAYPSASGSLATGYSADSAARTFYPFEPRLPSSAPIAAPVDAPRD